MTASSRGALAHAKAIGHDVGELVVDAIGTTVGIVFNLLLVWLP